MYQKGKADLPGVIECERTVEDAAGDLAAFGHLAECRSVERMLSVTVSTAERIATRG